MVRQSVFIKNDRFKDMAPNILNVGQFKDAFAQYINPKNNG
jgi:hypothetical protein